MKIEQFENRYLSHYSYAVLSESERKIILIDPSRDPAPYYEYARQEEAEITGVIETHSHADFLSSHLEIYRETGAEIFVSREMKPAFPFTAFDENDVIILGDIRLKALNTPGHSYDSISVVLEYKGKDRAVFTGDTLFIGDAGRPDLRETGAGTAIQREILAGKMYSSLHEKLMKLDNDVTVYPAHGAGTLCGKSLSDKRSSTIGNEKLSNWALQNMPRDKFVSELISDQPFIPSYFAYDVQVNIKGPAPFEESVSKVMTGSAPPANIDRDIWVVDVRPSKTFKQGHLPRSVNIMEGEKFETWLGSIIKPGESFYLAADTLNHADRMIRRAASIGYEEFIREAFVALKAPLQEPQLDVKHFRDHQEHYTIIDVRNLSETAERKLFTNSLSIPLPDLRNRIDEIPADKPIVVHCAGGYRSAAASSMISSELGNTTPVYDLGESVKEFN